MVFFDIDGTLIDYKFAELAGAIQFYHEQANIFKFTEEDFVRVWGDLAKEYYRRYLSKELSFQEQRRERVKKLFSTAGVNLSDQEADYKFDMYLSYYKTEFKPFDDVIPCLQQFPKEQLGIISNGDHQHQIDKLSSAGLLDYFSIVVTSGNVGYAKPDKTIFIEACYKAKEVPSKCYYVGDDLQIDILGSNSAGMKGIWINRKKDNHGVSNVTVIRDLRDLAYQVSGTI